MSSLTRRLEIRGSAEWRALREAERESRRLRKLRCPKRAIKPPTLSRAQVVSRLLFTTSELALTA